MTKKPIIYAQGLVKHFGRVVALDNADIMVEPYDN